MRRKSPPKASSYEVIDERVTERRVYQLVKFSLSKTSKTTTRRIMDDTLDQSNAIGLMEWWIRGSIIHKPKWQFYSTLF